MVILSIVDIIWVHVCTQGWRSRGSRATVKDPTRAIVVRSHVLRGVLPCKTEQMAMQEKVESASTEAAGDGLHTKWLGGRRGQGLDAKRHEGHGRVAPRQARPGEQKQKLATAGRVGLFGGEGERQTGDRESRTEQNRSSLHVSKGQPLPQYVLARCLQTGCTFRRKWTRLCFDSAVGPDRSDRQQQQRQSEVVVVVFTLASGRAGHGGQSGQSASQSVCQDRRAGPRIGRARRWILDEAQVPADGWADLADLRWRTELDVGSGRVGMEKNGAGREIGYNGSRWAGPTPKKSWKGRREGQGDADNARERVDGSGRGVRGRVA